MEPLDSTDLNRRDLIFKLLPSCAALCLGVSNIFAKRGALNQAPHKFDKVIDLPKLTYKQFFHGREAKFIRFCKAIVEELGEKNALKIIKNFTEKSMFKFGQRGAKRNSDDSFKSYIDMFKKPIMQNTLSMEIIEDTETVFEIKVTECLAYDIYKAEGFAGKFGYMCVCHGDFAWAEGYNPKIKLIRDKTLMQGHDCCNHRYVWKG